MPKHLSALWGLLVVLSLPSRAVEADEAVPQVILSQNEKIESVFLFMHATRWPGLGLTELEVWNGPRAFRVVTNVDFALLDHSPFIEENQVGVSTLVINSIIDSEGVEYLAAEGKVDSRGMPPDWPASLPPTAGRAQFVCIGRTQDADFGTVRGLEALHMFVEANRDKLIAEVKARATARQPEASKPPSPPRPPYVPQVISVSQRASTAPAGILTPEKQPSETAR